MSQQESENYNTIHTKPTYRSPIIRNRTIYKHEPSNIRQENIQDKQIQNKIDKTFTKINPVNNIYSNIQKNRERSQITELKEQNEQKQKNKLKKIYHRMIYLCRKIQRNIILLRSILLLTT
jgi:hypothetical protein